MASDSADGRSAAGAPGAAEPAGGSTGEACGSSAPSSSRTAAAIPSVERVCGARSGGKVAAAPSDDGTPAVAGRWAGRWAGPERAGGRADGPAGRDGRDAPAGPADPADLGGRVEDDMVSVACPAGGLEAGRAVAGTSTASPAWEPPSPRSNLRWTWPRARRPTSRARSEERRVG